MKLIALLLSSTLQAAPLTDAEWSAWRALNARVEEQAKGVPVTPTDPPVIPPAIPPATSRTLFVATTGSDSGSGTQANPFRTIQKAVSGSTAGTLISVNAGTYPEQVAVRQAGTATAAIVIKTTGGIIDGGNTRNYGFLVQAPATHVVIDGFEIKNTKLEGVLVEETNRVTIQNCVIHDTVRAGVYLRAADDCTVGWCDIFRTYIGVQVNWRDTTANRSDRATITHNLVHDNTRVAEDSDAIAISASTGSVVEYNFCWLNADDGIDVSASSGGTDKPMSATIRYNACWKNGDGAGNGDGNGIKTSTNAGGDHRVWGNVCSYNERAGFDNDQEGNHGGNFWWNNTAYANVYGIVLDMAGVSSATSAATVQNCLFTLNTTRDFYKSGTHVIKLESHNFVGGDPKLFNANAHITIPTSGTIAERWNNLNAQIQSNFRPQAGSPVVNRGVVIPNVTGPAPDQGAVEWE